MISAQRKASKNKFQKKQNLSNQIKMNFKPGGVRNNSLNAEDGCSSVLLFSPLPRVPTNV